ncbi:hypothetical protein A2U01_0078619, partial [Trifolium medium]|nr:hypothetical protein [Trifolium medium]
MDCCARRSSFWRAAQLILRAAQLLDGWPTRGAVDLTRGA